MSLQRAYREFREKSAAAKTESRKLAPEEAHAEYVRVVYGLNAARPGVLEAVAARTNAKNLGQYLAAGEEIKRLQAAGEIEP